ncbi:MAG: alpha/beta hydrolase [Alphaproteobacteria bacterium]|nr:alpha/beta hydrolase [Alphaproteobacteria bacterium]
MRLIRAGLIALGLAACSPSDAGHGLDAALLVGDLATRGYFLANWADPPRKEARQGADRYRGRSARAGIVLVPGLHTQGKDEANLVRLAETLARLGFVVHVPDLQNVRALRASAEDVGGIVKAVADLAADLPAGMPIGIAGVSYAAGPAVLAALDPLVATRVDFIFALGGYYDLNAVVAYFTTGQFRDEGGAWREGRPNVYGRWLFVRANAARLAEARDREVLEAIGLAKLRDPSAPIDHLVAELGPQGKSVMALLDNHDPAIVPALIAALPPGFGADFAALTLLGKPLSQLRAHVVLLHGKDDSIVPYTESRALAAALSSRQVSLHIAERLAHVDFDPKDWRDALAVWRAAFDLMRRRGPAA